MVLPKSKTSVGLGNALMNDRFGKGKGSDMHRVAKGIKRVGPDGVEYITTPKQEAEWMKMRSVTEQGSLDEFLSTAELAGTDFTAEKINNVKIIHRDQKNPYLLSAVEERATVRKQNANRTRLTVPRRPAWDEHTTAVDLDIREREALMQWRRGLAELQENNDLLMTPFERNLEVWRQLWRVIERSDLIVQIVDARNPLLFWCEDLDHYVKEVSSKKNNLLLVNKADMMSLKQRQTWADYFKQAGINFRFFSAELAKSMNEAREMTNGGAYDGLDDEMELNSDDEVVEDELPDDTKLTENTRKINLDGQEEDESEDDDDDDDGDDDEEAVPEADGEDGSQWESDDENDSEHEPNPDAQDPTRILTTDELESLFLQYAPQLDADAEGQTRKSIVGLVGYPNVGKSSTINALFGAKKVSVSATPGKTKHFQTLHLSDSVILCDCPGLVFPNFANTKAELVCNGVLPIDQLREYTGPATLVAQRIPQAFMEAVYGFRIQTRPAEEGGTGMPTGEEILRAYAIARGFATTGHSGPDEARAARYILKDYVKGKLLYCHAPPGDPPVDGKEFNLELYDTGHLPQKRRAALVAKEESALQESDALSVADSSNGVPLPPVQGQRTKDMDKRFFARGQNTGHLSQPFHQKYSEQGTASGKVLTGRKLKEMVALEKDVNPGDLKLNSKKHFKANKREKKQLRGEYV